MRVLMLGGTGMTGPFIASELIRRGHEITVYHSGKNESDLLPPCEHIHGDRRDREKFRSILENISADAVIDLHSMNDEDSEPVIAAFRGRIEASVHVSSGDVYASLGGLESVSEDSPLRDGPPYGGAIEDYDKKPMEEAVLTACREEDFPATVIRYPVIYGPGKRGGYREWGLVKRALDGRPRLALPERAFEFPLLRGYVENLAYGIAMALENKNAIGEIYNLADSQPITLAQLAQEIAKILNHSWELVSVSDDIWQGWIYNGPEGSYNIKKARQELGYEPPFDINEALRRTVLWQVENPPDDPFPWNIATDQFAYDAEDRLIAEVEQN